VLLRDPGFIAVAAAASLIQGSHALYYSFSTIDWQAAGFGGGTIGVLWALGVLAEIVLFALSARLPAAFSPSVLILIGGTGALVRWTAMALDPPGALLPLLQCLHGLSFGATHLGTLAFIGRAAPAGLAATAQGYLAVSIGVRDGGRNGIVRLALCALRRRCLRRNGADRSRGSRCGVRRAPDPDERVSLGYRQVGYIEASSRPVRYFISRVRPPRRLIQFLTFCGYTAISNCVPPRLVAGRPFSP
jgi:hypothetical protein